MRRVLGLLALAALATACPATGPGVDPTPSPTVTLQGPTVRVGASPEAESRLVAATVVELLARSGLDARVVTFEDSRDARQALELGDVDLLPGYTGAAWLDVLGRPDPPGDPNASWRRVRQLDDDLNDVIWLRPRFSEEDRPVLPPVNATFAFFVQGPPAASASIGRLSDLARVIIEASADEEAEPVSLCVDPEFGTRPDGLQAVLRAYAVPSEAVDIIGAAPADAIAGVRAGDCLAGFSTATDGAAWGAGLRPVRDELHVFPAFVLSVQVPDELLRERADVITALDPLLDQLTTELLGRSNSRVLLGTPEADVARELVDELLRRAAAEG